MILFIDTTADLALLAVVEDTDVRLQTLPSNRDLARDVLPTIEKLLVGKNRSASW